MNALSDLVSSNLLPTSSLPLVWSTLWIINNEFAKDENTAIMFGQYSANTNSYWLHDDMLREILKSLSQFGIQVTLFVQSETWHSNNPVQQTNGSSTASSNFFLSEYSRNSIWLLDSYESYK